MTYPKLHKTRIKAVYLKTIGKQWDEISAYERSVLNTFADELIEELEKISYTDNVKAEGIANMPNYYILVKHEAHSLITALINKGKQEEQKYWATFLHDKGLLSDEAFNKLDFGVKEHHG